MSYRLRQGFTKNNCEGFYDPTLDQELVLPENCDPKYEPEGYMHFILNISQRGYQDKLIQAYSSDAVVIDLGAGSGYAGINALLQGAKYVYFVEGDEIAAAMLCKGLQKSDIDKNRYGVIYKDIEDLERSDFPGPTPQVVYSEFYGPTIFDEGWYPYTQHLDSLFPNLYYAPGFQSMEIASWDADYTVSPWPYNHPELLDQVKTKYNNFMWNKYRLATAHDEIGPVKPHTKTIHGKFIYDANTKQLTERCVVTITKPEQMLGVFPIQYGSHDVEHYDEIPTFGWWIEEPGTYTLTMDIKNACKQAPRIIYPGEIDNGG